MNDGSGSRDDGAFTTGRQAGPQGDADRSRAAGTGLFRAPARSGRSRPAGQLRHQRPPRNIRCAARSPSRTSWRSPRRSATTGMAQGINGPLYMGKDTHALSGPAQRTALEVLAANGVETIIQRDDGFTPTPVISHAILVYNRGRSDRPRRRHRHHALAQSAGGRRLQVQPAQRRPGRHRRHQVDRGPRQRAAARRQCRR